MHEVKLFARKGFAGASLMLIIASTAPAAELLAIKSPPEFKAITTEDRPACTKPNSICWFEEKAGEKYSLWFDSTVDQTNNYRSITGVHIKNGKTGEVQSFNTPGVSRVDLNEPVHIYKAQLRKDGPTDIALFTNLSPHNGPLFFYFIFDPATKKFVMTDEEIPKLDFTNQANLYASDTRSEIKYELDSNLKLKQKFQPAAPSKKSNKVK